MCAKRICFFECVGVTKIINDAIQWIGKTNETSHTHYTKQSSTQIHTTKLKIKVDMHWKKSGFNAGYVFENNLGMA